MALVWIFKAHMLGEGQPCWDLSASWSEQLKDGPHCSAICPHHNVLPKVNVKGPRTETLETRRHNKPVFYFNFRLILSQVLWLSDTKLTHTLWLVGYITVPGRETTTAHTVET